MAPMAASNTPHFPTAEAEVETEPPFSALVLLTAPTDPVKVPMPILPTPALGNWPGADAKVWV